MHALRQHPQSTLRDCGRAAVPSAIGRAERETRRRARERFASLPRLPIAALLCVPLAACSVATYRQPVEAFAQATKDTSEALAAIDRQVTDGYADLLHERVVERKLFARIKAGDCGTESERCRIVAVGSDGTEQLLPPPSALQNMLLLMGSIQRYSDGLAAIVNADTAAQVSTEVGATVGSLKNLASTVAKLQGAGGAKNAVRLADYATPVGNLVDWLAGQYVASIQLDGLRRATVDARPVIAGAADVFAAAADEASRVSRARMAEEVSQRVDALRGSLGDRNLDAVVASATRYDALLRSKPPAVFRQLRDSHDALVARIQGENVTLAEVVAQVEAFAESARALVEIVRKLQAAGRNAEG